MKRNPVVIVTLLVLVLLTVPAGSLYVSASGRGSSSRQHSLAGTESIPLMVIPQREALFLPLVLYDLPPIPLDTSTATQHPQPHQHLQTHDKVCPMKWSSTTLSQGNLTQ